MKNYNKIKKYIEDNYTHREIIESDMTSFKENFDIESNIELFKEIVSNEKLLEVISERSYTHALGFDKIVLFDMSKDTDNDNKVQLRLHLWNPKSTGVPMTESMHEHSFNFISTILKGKLENQIFEMKNLKEVEIKELDLFLEILNKLSLEEKEFLNEQIELLEIKRLKNYDSEQYTYEVENKIDIKKIKKLLENKIENVYNTTMYQGHYVSNRVRGEKKAYKHVFSKYISLLPKDVLKLKEGDYYFHPYEYPHRLHYDNKEFNATLLITTPIPSNPQGGSLQRPTYKEGSEQNYDKIAMNKEILKSKILNLIKRLEG